MPIDPIYVTGHRNPDTDSVVAAMAYTALRHALGDREYEAACLGQVSDETRRVLDRFGFQPPTLITGMYTQVRDLDFDTPPVPGTGVTVDMGWKLLQQQKELGAVPVANADGTLYGMLFQEDVADYNMGQIHAARLGAVPLFNLLSVLEGRVLNEAGEKRDTLCGEVVIALPQDREGLLFDRKDTVVLCGHQPDMIRRALERNVNCLVLCRAELPAEFRDIGTDTCIISTPFDAYRAARLIFQSVPIGQLCRTALPAVFHLEDRVDEVREQVLKHRQRCYPVLDENEKVAGVLTRYHLLRPRRKRVVLVDHNEVAQSVPGLEEAEVLEIIDHHRLADIQTAKPIRVRNEPVGSTNTIIAAMFQERGLMPAPAMAGMMAAAIVSDTVMFKSPTCTDRDIQMAHRLARMAGVSPEELGRDVFSVPMEGRTAEELLFTDYKEFRIAGQELAISQITCADCEPLLGRKEEFLTLMEKTAAEGKFDLVALMLTDVLRSGTRLLFVGDEDTVRQAFHVQPRDNEVFLPGILSRKKQIIPMLSALWG